MRTGLVFLPVAATVTVGAHLGGQALGRFGWRPVGVGAFGLAAAGAGLLTRLSAAGNVWMDLVPGFALLSLGLGAAFVCATTAAMHGLPHRDTGLASGLIGTAHELGAALGVAVLAAIAGAALDGAGGVTGFRHAFLACAAIAVAAAAASAVLLPRDRPDPDQARAMAH
ncbi:hypothetical protein [Embleya sp. NPDC020630]|uniref:hypothetical protein n=1 Tax=Embleya sp. NPDC020630 TaxID=3363979 RepID=UPI0037A3DCD4